MDHLNFVNGPSYLIIKTIPNYITNYKFNNLISDLLLISNHFQKYVAWSGLARTWPWPGQGLALAWPGQAMAKWRVRRS